MNIKFKDKALEQLSKLPKGVQRRILGKLKFFVSTNKPLQFAHFIKDKKLGGYRFRIGDYRAVFDANDGEIEILKIGHRKDIYKVSS